eukprot:TRINITY_DN9183_c0_g1_i1.p1 TRINITY_DN9183_c0_g1~~TRINITY_DN9183_c0_g1_i1.p1  ORF type:complete len:634 (-),score=150.53 TRINITY_DN9183_c0_g1_i1:91-1776(-)
MAVPDKFKEMGTFYKYYSGEVVAPVPTIFIGGNHEASNFLQELPFGGWAAPNIYFMGYAGVVTFGGIRIAGISGIYKGYNYDKGHFETPPYSEDQKRSVYHVRRTEVFKLLQLKEHVDIFMSHDWPRGVEQHGDVNWLISKKTHFEREISQNNLGNPAHEKLLNFHKPDFWFSAHLHVKFPALVEHEDGKVTKFLSLDKCLPRRNFLQVIDIPIPTEAEKKLCYDVEWLAVLKSTAFLDSVKPGVARLPATSGSERFEFVPTQEEKEEILKRFPDLEIPQNFAKTVIPYHPDSGSTSTNATFLCDPQTLAFAAKLNLKSAYIEYFLQNPVKDASVSKDPAEINFDDDDDDDGDEEKKQEVSRDPAEINFDQHDEEEEEKKPRQEASRDPAEINFDDDADEDEEKQEGEDQHEPVTQKRCAPHHSDFNSAPAPKKIRMSPEQLQNSANATPDPFEIEFDDFGCPTEKSSEQKSDIFGSGSIPAPRSRISASLPPPRGALSGNLPAPSFDILGNLPAPRSDIFSDLVAPKASNPGGIGKNIRTLEEDPFEVEYDDFGQPIQKS